MTELEKMKKGEYFYPGNEEVSSLIEKAQELCFKLNNTIPSNYDELLKITKEIVGSFGDESFIRPPFHADFGFNIKIGDNFFSNYNLTILDAGEVIIGNNVMIGPNCTITTVSHPIHFKDRNTFLEYGRGVSIGNNVWIASNVTINPGVNIGDNSVIASGALVTKDVAANSLVMGIPGKVVKKITDEDRIGLKNIFL